MFMSIFSMQTICSVLLYKIWCDIVCTAKEKQSFHYTRMASRSEGSVCTCTLRMTFDERKREKERETGKRNFARAQVRREWQASLKENNIKRAIASHFCMQT